MYSTSLILNGLTFFLYFMKAECCQFEIIVRYSLSNRNLSERGDGTRDDDIRGSSGLCARVWTRLGAMLIK